MILIARPISIRLFSLKSLAAFSFLAIFCILLSTARFAAAQDATGFLEGHVSDASGAIVRGATITLRNIATNASRTQPSDNDGLYRFVQLGIGQYALNVDAQGFARFEQSPIEIIVTQTRRVDVALSLGSVTQSVVIIVAPAAIDTTTNTLGKVVGEREVLDLPLKGRNFAQLGLLQTGVAPLSSGVTTEGGSLRQGQSYAVNGQRPEGNNFLLDGVQNVNRMDGGYALKIPIDAIAEFRILTSTAPPEFGGNTRAQSFNVANHANFGLPIADLNSPNFGRILLAGPPRLTQFALKTIF